MVGRGGSSEFGRVRAARPSFTAFRSSWLSISSIVVVVIIVVIVIVVFHFGFIQIHVIVIMMMLTMMITMLVVITTKLVRLHLGELLAHFSLVGRFLVKALALLLQAFSQGFFFGLSGGNLLPGVLFFSAGFFFLLALLFVNDGGCDRGDDAGVDWSCTAVVCVVVGGEEGQSRRRRSVSAKGPCASIHQVLLRVGQRLDGGALRLLQFQRQLFHFRLQRDFVKDRHGRRYSRQTLIAPLVHFAPMPAHSLFHRQRGHLAWCVCVCACL